MMRLAFLPVVLLIACGLIGCGDGSTPAPIVIRPDAALSSVNADAEPVAGNADAAAVVTHPDAAAIVHPDATPGQDAAPPIDAGTPFPDYGMTAGPTPGLCLPSAGQTGNNLNVGAYCTPGGRECAPYAFSLVCAIDVDPMGDNFCIHIGCRDHATCGDQGCCTGRPGALAHACVPKGCLQDDMAAECPPVP